MKKITAIFISCIMALCLVLTGCGGDVSENNTSSENTTEENNSSTENSTEEPEPLTGIRAAFTETGTPGLYEAPYTIEGIQSMEAVWSDGKCFVLYQPVSESGSEENEEGPGMLAVIDPEEGVIASRPVEREIYVYNLLPVEGGKCALFLWDDYSYQIFDSQLSDPLTITAKAPGGNMGCVRSDGKAVVIPDSVNGGIVSVDVESGELTELLSAEELKECSGASRDTNGGILYVERWDYDLEKTIHYCFDQYTGEKILGDMECSVELSPDKKEYLLFISGSKGDQDSAQLFDTETGELKAQILLNESGETWNCYADWENRQLFTFLLNGDVITLRAYSIDTGVLSSVTAFSDEDAGCWPYGCHIDDQDLFCTTFYSDNCLRFYAWDYAVSGVSPEDLYSKHKIELSPELLARRDAMEDKYNVYIYLGTEIAVADFTYKVDACKSERLMSKGLDVLEDVFALYPSNYFEELKQGAYKTLGFYFCTGFTATGGDTISTAAALASTTGYERSIVLDVNYNKEELVKNLVHEISHWTDSLIEEKSAMGYLDEDFGMTWESYNPEDFSYMYMYNYEEGDWRYVFDGENDPDKCYFYDSYSTTFPTEDRARLFENIMYPDGFVFTLPMLDKTDYYFKCIREVFDSSSWPSETLWEKSAAEMRAKAAAGETGYQQQ